MPPCTFNPIGSLNQKVWRCAFGRRANEIGLKGCVENMERISAGFGDGQKKMTENAFDSRTVEHNVTNARNKARIFRFI